MSRVLLGNGVVLVDLQWAEAAEPLARCLASFLDPWFRPVDPAGAADMTMRLAPSAEFGRARRALCVETFTLRRSSAAIFNLEVMRGVSAEGFGLAWDEVRQVGYAIDRAAARIEFYGSAPNAFIHLIELVRYYGLLAEQAKGTAILHSAAVRHRGSDDVVAIVGAKGAGKTTTMLSMLASGEYEYFSGDKLLLNMQGDGLRVRGWPDYPHIGIGTLRQHVLLAGRLGIGVDALNGSMLPDHYKMLIEPSRFLAAIGKPTQACGTLSRVVLPRIQMRGLLRQAPVADGDKAAAVRQGDLFEWPHQFVTSTWHGLPLADRTYSTHVDANLMRALQKLPWEHRFGEDSAPSRRTEEAL